MVESFYTTKQRFRNDIKVFLEKIIIDPTINDNEGRLLLGHDEIQELHKIVLENGFSIRVLKSELSLFGFNYDEEKHILNRV
jgi:hypothetical protein